MHDRRLKLTTLSGVNIGNYPLKDVLDFQDGVEIEVAAHMTELSVCLFWEQRDETKIRTAEVVVTPEVVDNVRKWFVRLPTSTITLVPSEPMETEFFQVTYEGDGVEGVLIGGDPWDGSPISAEAFPGTYTLSGYFAAAGQHDDEPETMASRLRFDPPLVEARDGQEVTVVVSVVVYNAWLPVDVGSGVVRHVWALEPDGLRVIGQDELRFWPETLHEVDRGKANGVAGWHLTDDGRLFVAPDEAGSREGIGVGPFALVELEDGNYLVIDVKDRDPAFGGTILPDSTTDADSGIDIRVNYEGESPPDSIEIDITCTRVYQPVAGRPRILLLKRRLTVAMGQSKLKVPQGFRCWITNVYAKSGNSRKRVVSPAREESMLGKTYGDGLMNGDSLIVGLQD